MGEATEQLQLIQFLQNRDEPCPQCGYNLRNLPTNICPECGDELALRVNIVEPRTGLLVAGVVGLAMGAGFSALLLVYFLFDVLVGPYGPSGNEIIKILTLLGGGLAVEGGLVFVWIRQWRRIRKMPATTRTLLILACYALSLTNLILFATTVK